ncbi:MAG TPA: DUF3298 and DUF4163 domain-containing protein [Pyrinomonadaceae bacterium]|nr:DUF3298 and DUF4163 domain-containing protein [Pyrinomonadaceae bacterium]
MNRIFLLIGLIITTFIGQIFAQNGTKVFRGNVGGSSVQLTLKRDGNKLSGTYFYQKVKKDLRLEGTIDNEGNFKLTEFAPNNTKTGEFAGKWSSSETDIGVSLTGNWINPKNKEETYFSAQEQYVEFTGSRKLKNKTFAEKNKPRMYDITAEYPVLSGGNAMIDAKFNKLMLAEVMKPVNSFKKDMVGMTAQDFKYMKDAGMTYYLESDYTIELANDKIVSIGIFSSTFEGGAHPNHFSSAFNFDLSTGTVLKLKDLFKPGANYLKTISALCIKKLKESDQEEFDDEWLANGAGPKEENFSSWNIKKNGILINFDPYQVSSYASGPHDVLITFDELKSILKKDGIVGK